MNATMKKTLTVCLALAALCLPAAAQKQLTEVLPYELEAELPFELSEAVYDYAILKRASDEAGISVFAVVARTFASRRRPRVTCCPACRRRSMRWWRAAWPSRPTSASRR